MENGFEELYHKSGAYIIIKKVSGNLSVFIKSSAIYMLADMKGQNRKTGSNDNGIMRLIGSQFKLRIERMLEYSKRSMLAHFLNKAKKELSHAPARGVGIIIIVLILTNISLSFLLSKKTNLFYWIPRSLFVIVGSLCLFCDSSWKEIKDTARILKFMDRYHADPKK